MEKEMVVLLRAVAFLVLCVIKESASVCSHPNCGACTTPMMAKFNATGWEVPYSPDRLQLFSVGGWCPPTNTSGQYIQVDLGESKRVIAMATRAWQADGSSMSRFKLDYSNNTNNWTTYQENGTDKEFQRFPNNESLLLEFFFATPVVSRYFRFSILERYEELFCLEAELYYEEGSQQTQTALLTDLDDSAFNATGSQAPSSAHRLKLYSVGGWCPPTNSSGQYVQVELENIALVRGITTREWHVNNSYTTRFNLAYSNYTNDTWITFQENGTDKVFEGTPGDGKFLLKAIFPTAVAAKYFRFLILPGHEEFFCLEAELYEEEAPVMHVKYPRNATIREGRTAVFWCGVTRCPEVDMTWERMGSNEANYSLGKKLSLYDVSPADTGYYRCNATNDVGGPVSSRWAYLFVTVPPELDSSLPLDQTVIEGQSLTLRCNVTAGIPSPSIEWTKVGNNAVLASEQLLTLANVTRNNAGTYRCTADNDVGNAANSDAQLTVLYPPSLDSSKPENQTVIEGNMLSLQCLVTAALPAVNITWYKIGGSHRNFPKTANLSFNATREDSGSYYCVADNGIGDSVNSRVSTVVVLFPPELDSSLPLNQTVIEGQSLTLRCNVTAGIPSPSVEWTKVGNNAVLASEQLLTLASVTRNNAGTYQCTADNDVGNAANSDAQLTVLYPPSLDSSKPENQTVIEGNMLSLQCLVTAALPAANITWYKIGGSHRNFTQTANLSFNATREDSGSYYCVADNGIGDSVNSRVSTVVVFFPPDLDEVHPQNKTIVQGDSVNFHCNSTALPAANVTWKKLYESQKNFTAGINLTFIVTRNDTGSYQCNADNGVGSRKSRVAYLLVHFPPSLDDINPENQALTEGTFVTLLCNVTTAVPASTITWEKLGEGSRVYPTGHTLTFNVSRGDSGQYICIADNGINPTATSRVAIVDVQYPPKVQMVTPSQLTVYEGVNITLECNISGNPVPAIQWTMGNVSSAVLSSQTTLRMAEINLTKSGTYYCTASNGIGSPDTGSVVVTVREMPQHMTQSMGIHEWLIIVLCVCIGILIISIIIYVVIAVCYVVKRR